MSLKTILEQSEVQDQATKQSIHRAIKAHNKIKETSVNFWNGAAEPDEQAKVQPTPVPVEGIGSQSTKINQRGGKLELPALKISKDTSSNRKTDLKLKNLRTSTMMDLIDKVSSPGLKEQMKEARDTDRSDTGTPGSPTRIP